MQQLTGWGRATSSPAFGRWAVSVPDVAAAVRAAGPRGVLARGLGRSYGDAAQNSGGLVLMPLDPAAPIDLDRRDGTVRVSAGTSLVRLLRELLPLGRMVPVLPGTGQVSVGGAIAADVHGKNHHRQGSFGQWTRSLELVDGLGDVRSLSAAEPGFWATVGGMGLTGVVTSAVLQTVPVSSGRLDVRTRRLSSLAEVLNALRVSSATYSVAWLDGANAAALGRGVVEEAELDPTPGDLCYPDHRAFTVPRLPVNVIRPLVSRQLNRVWWHRAPRDASRSTDFRAFFHPLDAVRAWPRLYGPRGLLQWQFVVPDAGEELVGTSLRALLDAGRPPALVVLKRMGEGRGGALSFPREGWSLAVDLPADPGTGAVLDRLDRVLADAGGRVYLAKDARMSRAVLERMYPELGAWREVRRDLDPHGVFTSDLARRLGLS
jgi:decaprenylphospho-beta-D-ribofuranose 2-oxidase